MLACVVDDVVIWDRAQPAEVHALDGALRRFVAARVWRSSRSRSRRSVAASPSCWSSLARGSKHFDEPPARASSTLVSALMRKRATSLPIAAGAVVI
jgi:hypothetical protein